ncbi:carbohydrate ABC transporter permease [Hydrogenoanaerobacterium sp.]|uniref:carbohydrate ABC transporter permease n=1 Tax=Hydrogenoanaerobacterium sp. TaxID=2953763 RepID=UPI0028A1C20F|nr:carbohydrate ABC transporter permease [Hydrogenoanaerobacterium sp.]
MIKRAFQYLFLSVTAFVSIFPFFWMIVGATNASVDVTKGKLTFGSQLIDNVLKAVKTTNIVSGVRNSFFVAIVATVLAIFVSSLAGYGFEIFKSKGRNKVFNLLLLSMMIPFAALMIPLYRMFSELGLLNRFSAIIIPSISTAFLIFFFRQNTKSFPRELLQAARIDGLGELGIFLKIYFPTMKSTYAAAGIITFMNMWNSYMWPLIALQTNEKKTLPLIIATLNSSYTPDYGVIMVSIVIATIPSAIVFFVMQKSFVEGMTGSVKG